jgi:LacI family transcriptional regulator
VTDRRRETRLKDIAIKTGFSINTVSVAPRNGARIPDPTREIIMAAARELDYRPNAVARSLVQRSTRTVGVILSNLLNPILTLCAQYIEQRLAERGYTTVLATTDNDLVKEQEALDTLRAQQVAGILIYPTVRTRLDHILPLRRAGYPVLLLTGEPSGEIDLVGVDNRSGARKITAYLLGLGHRRIAFLDGGQPQGNLEKQEGYEAAFAAAGLEIDRDLLFSPAGGTTARHGHEAMARIMARDPAPTAVFASSDSMAIGVMRWCREHELKVPDDLSIAGFDDIETSAFLDCPLTTVGYSTRTVSEQAVTRLIALMEAKGELPAPDTLTIDPDLVIRGSCGAPGRR